MNRNVIGGIAGNVVSFTGVAVEKTNEMADIVSIVVSILGLIITILSMIVIPLIKWYKEAKKDGKIDEKEIKEAIEIVENALDKNASKNKEQKGEKKDD